MNNGLWTQEREAVLKAGLNDGLSYREISAKLNCGLSRNACIGKAHRLGIRGEPTPNKVTAKAIRERRCRSEAQKLKWTDPDFSRLGHLHCVSIRPLGLAARQAAADLRPRPPKRVGPPPIESRPTPFLEAQSGQCQYPLWDDPRPPIEQRMVCGAEADGTYCAGHKALCFTSASQRDFDRIAYRTMGRISGESRILAA